MMHLGCQKYGHELTLLEFRRYLRGLAPNPVEAAAKVQHPNLAEPKMIGPKSHKWYKMDFSRALKNVDSIAMFVHCIAN